MTATEIDHAEQLYLAGHSLTACAKLTGFPASSINRALNKRGTPMRPAGRPAPIPRPAVVVSTHRAKRSRGSTSTTEPAA
ncbi:hypothetical protein ACFXHA_39120 [Nocardia sp. NPDC059240]|uniref:hypothetical protein n=1 Tax=Nocardia sp. NPDC059240 TaxID=3346786 RepID=UPI0036C5AAB9